jgi:hypothetical protein
MAAGDEVGDARETDSRFGDNIEVGVHELLVVCMPTEADGDGLDVVDADSVRVANPAATTS